MVTMTNLEEFAEGHWQLIGIRLNLSPLLAEIVLVRIHKNTSATTPPA